MSTYHDPSSIAIIYPHLLSVDNKCKDFSALHHSTQFYYCASWLSLGAEPHDWATAGVMMCHWIS